MNAITPPSSRLRALVSAASIVIVAFALAACGAPPPPPADPVVPVTTAQAVSKPLPIEIVAIGTIEPIDSVQVKSRVDGQVVQAPIRDGQDVKQGEILFRIDPRPLEAALRQAEAALARDRAQLAQADTQRKRYAGIAQKGFVSKEQLEQVETALDVAKATVQLDQANVAAAQLDVDYSTIRAPIDGRVGRVLVQVGNLVKANDAAPLIVINRLTPIYATFSLPGKLLGDVRAAQAHATLAASAAIVGSGGAPVAAQNGELAFVDNAIDAATGTIKLRARFDNAVESLWPGQQVSVTLDLGEQRDAVVVPDVAIKQGPDGPYVFLVKGDRAAQQPVEVVRSHGGETALAKGVAAGDVVVTDGQSRLADGARVKIGQATP